MTLTRARQGTWLVVLVALTVVPCVEAVILEGTGDPSYNTNAPTGSLTNSGWQYEGQWTTENGPNFIGTPIAPTFFLTAQHVGGTASLNNDQFVFLGSSYTVVTNFDDPSTDLRIWQVLQTFPYYAPLYTGGSESNQTCVVIGRGYERGPVIVTTTNTFRGVTVTTNGWQWANPYGIERWGQNTVLGITDAGTSDAHPGEQMLYAAFAQSANSNECMLAAYDSSGGMFIETNSTWQLAGINYEITAALVSTNAGTDSFNAALLDYYNLWYWNGAAWVYYSGHSPQEFYCTRVSDRVSWINSVLTTNPTAIFTASPTNGAAPLSVTFTDGSTGSITNRFWNFGDGDTTNLAVGADPVHTYLNPGSYSVTLVASGAGGSSTKTVTNLIGVYDPFAWWQLSYFDTTNNNTDAAPGDDVYGTGMSNSNKFLAGFSPTNAAAYLHIIGIAPSGTNVVVTYLGASGDTNYVPGVQSRTNVLDFTTGDASGNYTNGGWQETGQTNILGAGLTYDGSGGTGLGTVTNMTDSSGATNSPSRYYRVRILLP